jgi:serine/threonine protein kinase
MVLQVVGTLGYAAPEYMKTGHLTAKCDIWGYGILLYELITGRRPIDRNRPKGEQKLLVWVKPYISNVKRFPIIVDPRLGGHYNLESMISLAAVANRCLIRLPKSRPKMSEVYEMVQKIVDSIESGLPQPPLHYHGSVSEPGAKRMKKKGSLKRRFHELKFSSRQILWRGWKHKNETIAGTSTRRRFFIEEDSVRYLNPSPRNSNLGLAESKTCSHTTPPGYYPVLRL